MPTPRQPRGNGNAHFLPLMIKSNRTGSPPKDNPTARGVGDPEPTSANDSFESTTEKE
jgi:hypothetical protein